MGGNYGRQVYKQLEETLEKLEDQEKENHALQAAMETQRKMIQKLQAE
jgi:predicted RNase H-like nuclease (RuvC/YqgF family)